jgi:hypothetical protein
MSRCAKTQSSRRSQAWREHFQWDDDSTKVAGARSYELR